MSINWKPERLTWNHNKSLDTKSRVYYEAVSF